MTFPMAISAVSRGGFGGWLDCRRRRNNRFRCFYQSVHLDELNGMQSLETYLIDLGIDLAGWHLDSALAISADGTTIVGYGGNPYGQPAAVGGAHQCCSRTAHARARARLFEFAGFDHVEIVTGSACENGYAIVAERLLI